MQIVRVLLQTLILVFFLAVLGSVLLSSPTPTDIVNMIGAAVFFAFLFMATFEIGDKRKNYVVVAGYKVNPKVFGTMMVLLGVFMFFGSWRILSGQPMGSGRRRALAQFIAEIGPEIPATVLVILGIGAIWYGYRMYRAK